MCETNIFYHAVKKREMRVKVNLAVMLYTEDNIHYAFCPALDLYGYGYTDDEAKKSFEVCLSEVVRYSLEHGKFGDVFRNVIGNIGTVAV